MSVFFLNIFLLLFTSLASFISLYFLYKYAYLHKLYDSRDERKEHDGEIPLIGGPSIYLGVFLSIFFFQITTDNLYFIFLLSTIVFILGLVDDKKSLSPSFRLLIQIFVASMLYYEGTNISFMAFIEDHTFSSLPNFLSFFITVFFVVGIINSINFLDGIDGLAGAIVVLIIIFLFGIAIFNNQPIIALICLILISGILPFLLQNLGLIFKTKKVFLGDSGSTLLGFSIAWISIRLINTNHDLFESQISNLVSILWIIALPIMDSFSVIFRRVIHAKSPFKPDRTHIHHMLQNRNFSDKNALLVIIMISFLLSSFGLLISYYLDNYLYSLGVFITALLIYFMVFISITEKKSP